MTAREITEIWLKDISWPITSIRDLNLDYLEELIDDELWSR